MNLKLVNSFAAAMIGLMVNDMSEYSLFDLPDGGNPVCSLDPYCRALNDNEVTLARSVFGDNVDLTHVKIFTRPLWPSALFIPEDVVAFVAKHTNIHSRLGSDQSEDMSRIDKDIMGTPIGAIFVHEMTHIWQHQHYGSEETGQKRAKEYMDAKDKLGDKFRSSALYNVDLFDYPNFDEFGIEQQAEIVSDYNTLRGFILDLYNTDGYTPYWFNTQMLCIQAKRYKELLEDVVRPGMFTDFPDSFTCKL